MNPCVKADSLVTLNYRISLEEGGQTVIDTFAGNPATLQLGAGDMVPAMEACLVGLEVGKRQTFSLTAGDAFGEYKQELVEHVKREHMKDEEIEVPSVMEFVAPDGSRYQGLVREMNDEVAVVDFNHPLAGKAIAFEVEVIGIV